MAAFRNRLERWAQVAGLLATGWVVWATSVAPQWRRGKLWQQIAAAAFIAVWALIWSFAMALALRYVSRRPKRMEAETLPASAVAVWFAPATILLLQFSATGLTAGLALVVAATRLLCASSWIRDAEADRPGAHFALAMIVSVGLQTAASSILMGHRLPAAGLLAMSVAVLTSLAIGRCVWDEDRPPNLPRSVLGLCLTVLLALMIGHGGGFGWGFGWGSGTGSDPHGSKSASNDGKRPLEPTPGMSAAGDYAGVILWPEIKPVTTLIAPMMKGGGVFAEAHRPLSIPFGGEYWMFRLPFTRPPKSSFFKRGTPTSLFFSTTDRWPLQMEAHHKLEQAININCCVAMRIEIRNADRRPGTIRLGVVLIDGKLPRAIQDLGSAPILSVPNANTDHPAPVPETLDFPFPAAPRLDRFDEIKVIFYLATVRRDKSARIAIERFVLTPRN